MHTNFKRLMADATRLTRAGDLRAATRAIRHGLDSTRAQRDVSAPQGNPPGEDARVLDGRCTRLDESIDTPTADGSTEGATGESARRSSDGPARQGHSPERVIRARHVDRRGTLDYRLFVPARAPGSAPPPMLVMLHGCTQNAEDFAVGTRMDEHARRHGCLVLYPDQSDRANPQRCWNWFKHSHQRRGGGEAGLIERCVHAIVADHGVDARRVFVAGLSAGGAMAAILGQACPELFAGVGVHSGLAAGAAGNLPEALAAMQRGAAAANASAAASPPTIVFHGDADRVVHPCNGEHIIDACGKHSAGAERVAPASVRQAGRGGKHAWTRRVHRAPDGTLAAEHWCVHGAGHAWSGGDARGSYTDPAGPDASAQMLRFFLAIR